MAPETPRVDEALPAVRKLLEGARIPYKLVGGVAVVHHGYARFTEDIDVLVDGSRLSALDLALGAHGFERESHTRLRHAETGVRVDLLIGGAPRPRASDPPYPDPATLAGSADDPAIVALAPLLELKIVARRHQDLADVVELLKRIDEGPYLDVESKLPVALRPRLAELRRDALEELGSPT